MLSGSQTRQPLGDSGAALGSLPFFTYESPVLASPFPRKEVWVGTGESGLRHWLRSQFSYCVWETQCLAKECRKQRHAGVREWKELTHGSSWFLVRKTRTLIIVIVLGLNSTVSNYVTTLCCVFIRAAGMDFLKGPVPRLGLDYLCTGVTGVWLDTERLWGSGTKPEVTSFSVTPSPGPLTGGGVTLDQRTLPSRPWMLHFVV